ncbi:hypothetical protein DPMN_123804 [Dreissena polymorpha]|uniref:Uncharacterized protein n=1 Tax=Dreissena polymorpha TaxID=45954 RepID=A0A9D4JRM4_DREPO|nr:hypothetical protein DPMN_123804 [Dreissena polymorpha]
MGTHFVAVLPAMVGTAMVVQGMAVDFVGTDQLVAQGTGMAMVLVVVSVLELVVGTDQFVAQMGIGKEMVVVIVKLVVSVLELVALTSTDEEMVFVFVHFVAMVSFPQNKLNLNQ